MGKRKEDFQNGRTCPEEMESFLQHCVWTVGINHNGEGRNYSQKEIQDLLSSHNPETKNNTYMGPVKLMMLQMLQMLQI